MTNLKISPTLEEKYPRSHAWPDYDFEFPVKERLIKNFPNMKSFNCLEVGLCEGKNTNKIIKDLVGEEGTYHGIERKILPNLFENIEQSRQLLQEKFVLHDEDSFTSLPNLINEYKEFFHFIFIDAGKSAIENCFNLSVCERLLSLNGIMICDDYNWPAQRFRLKRIPRDIRTEPRMGIDNYINMTVLTRNEKAYHTVLFEKIDVNTKINLINL